MNKVAFIYHVNFNHLSLTFGQRVEYLNRFDYLISKISFPVTLSIFGEDLIFLSIKNPQALQEIKRNNNIRLFIPQYSHMLPYVFPTYLDLQINLGKKVINQLGLVGKMNNILYSSEVDYLSPRVWPNLTSLVDGLVVGETRLRIKGMNEVFYPSILTTKFNEKPLDLYISRRKLQYREYLHRFLRNEIEESQLNNALLEDTNKYAKQTPLIARIDLEVLIFNVLKDSGVTFENRTDKWVQYMEQLDSVGIIPIFLDDINTTVLDIPHIDETLLSRNTVEDSRWSNDALFNKLKLFDYIKLSSKKKAILLSLLCSDYFCSNLKDFILETNYGKLVICKTRKYRDVESALKICLLQNKTLSSSDLQSDYIRTFLQVIEKVGVLL
ncbi:hypothetical protein KJ953_00915 [Patescibacteria group bacterium]|nr:hypothetical protein [Patescibacteria group bacterium]